MSAVKDIVIMGCPNYLGAVLLRKLIRAGHRVKASEKLIYRKDVQCIDVLQIIGHENLRELDEGLPEAATFKDQVLGAEIVYYFDWIPGPGENQAQECDVSDFIETAAAAGVKRFIYVTSSDNNNYVEIKSMAKITEDSFSVMVVDVSSLFARSLTKSFTMTVDIFSGQKHVSQRVVLSAGRQSVGYVARHVLPNSWYASKNDQPLKNFAQEVVLAFLCLSEGPLDQLLSNSCSRWILRRISLKQSRLCSKLLGFPQSPRIPGAGYVKNIFLTLQRLFDVMMLMFFIQVRPDQAYRFSTRKCLPSPSARFKLENKPVVPFKLIPSRSRVIQPMKNVNLVMRGSSFDIKQLDRLEGPIFLVSYWEPIETSKNVIYLMGRAKACLRLVKLGYQVICTEVLSPDKNGDLTPNDQDHQQAWYSKFREEGLCPWISLEEDLYASYDPQLWTPTGSAIPAICAVYPFAETINIYGWDFYLNAPGNTMSESQFYSQLYKLRLDVTRSRNHVESALYNFYYAYQFSQLPNIKIHSYLGQLDKHAKLMKKFERVLFNP